MKFKILVPAWSRQIYVDAEGVPPDETYPEFFVSDDGWIYPVCSVDAFRLSAAKEPK